MGITIHYRGQLADVDRAEQFEDRLIDLVLQLGGDANIWRSIADHNSERIIRGLIVDLAPGQETLSLLLSPEGWLVPLTGIEQAERGDFDEPPHCFVKTQCGPVEGHAALVELFTLIKVEFMPGLEVQDEAGYWDHRDPMQLAEMMARTQQMIGELADALRRDSLSPEAAEDPEILAARIERIAMQIHASRQQGGSGTPPSADSTDPWIREEVKWDAMDRSNRARQRRLERRIEERLLRGETNEQALKAAMDEEFPPSDEASSDLPDDFKDALDDDWVDDEPWRESLPETCRDTERLFAEPPPLLQRATDLLFALENLQRDGDSAITQSATRHACEICGGLSQVLPLPPAYDLDEITRGLCVTQLKRSLRGAAFLRGVLCNVTPTSDRGEEATRLRKSVEAIQSEIVELLKEARPEPREFNGDEE